MADSKVVLRVDTKDLDEAIVKAKILNEELEKARSIINDLAGGQKTCCKKIKSFPDISIKFENYDESKINELSEAVLIKVRSLLERN